ncbi:metallophosphoesterase [Pseudotamlana carrageenivorans]|uniref:Phosphoesterase n=1 Tax=Pseudotamlana carrageenivorans TaxID=2069432 RepID=A0A2I7SHZ6_9FLAO|nr:metallophosphoesterase [Tamlana carrageenivorans]AUS05509.1 phosphoesterase [Tamlana carrageenivorans]
MKVLKLFFVVVTLFFASACATYKPQYKTKAIVSKFPDKTIVHSFYLIGDAGNSPIGTATETLKAFKKDLAQASKNSTAIFLGDNIYPKGMPNKKDKGRAFAEHQLDMQIDAVTNFKGQTLFIPGNHDWYNDGLKGLKRQEKYIEDRLGKNTFLPEKGCPIERVKISDHTVLIVIDSEWYLTNWDKHPTINDACDIKTRDKFFDEFESEIKKARGKTTIVAIHHPMFTNGSHGGQYGFKSHMTPVPVLGTLKNVIRKTGGVVSVDDQNKCYLELKKRLVTLSQENEKAIFVSGHDHNLQYLIQDNLPQIISGAGSKTNPTRLVGGGQFSYGAPGYARLDVFNDGASYVRFYSNNRVVFQSEVLPKDLENNFNDLVENFPKEKKASIYSRSETEKSSFHKWLFGVRYREDFSTPVLAPTVNLDTLFGGLTPVRKGGGHQSKSLRLVDKNGREYVMRALRKNAEQYMQAVAFKEQYIEGQFAETYTEGLMLDVFTGSHPYAPFVVGDLADAIHVYHTNPVLYYVPKQKAIGAYNDEFGDALYMIEERTDSGHGNQASFGFSNTMVSTDDLLKNLTADEKYIVDEAAYIKARLFDMLIGDWDRHEDQWRWAAFKEAGKVVYRPVPRDRDQAFSVMADGFLLNLLTVLEPSVRGMKSYSETLKKPKWFNAAPYALDMALINQSDKKVWDVQVQFIQKHITDAVIDAAFSHVPPEVNQQSIADIKRKLKGRREHLQQISDAYFNHIRKFAVVKGTHKDDWFEIIRLPKGETKVTVYRIKNGEKADVVHQHTYHRKATKEIWVFGLDDNDHFEVTGDGKQAIKLRLIGGQNNDVYAVSNARKLKIYDQKSKNNQFLTRKGKKTLADDYEVNLYDYKKLKNNTNQLLPALGLNPDDGFRLGFKNTWTNYGFERNPFTSKHRVSASYYFATHGFDLAYKVELTHVIGDFNLGLEALFTSPNYTINFFGYGNNTPNFEADNHDGTHVNMNYNRVKLETLSFAPSLIWRGQLGAHFQFGAAYENIEVEETAGRFINEAFIGDNVSFTNEFLGVYAKYEFENQDNKAFPTLGMLFALETGYKNNMGNRKDFAYIIPTLAFDYKLVDHGKLVLATKFKGHLNFGDGFEFYQAANIGANNGLRGYRNERFTGKSAFYQTSDLRFNFQKVKTSLLPLYLGVYGGFDYGRVWVDDRLVLDSAYNANRWNTSVGGGVFINGVDLFTLNMALFHSQDGMRFSFGLGMDL